MARGAIGGGEMPIFEFRVVSPQTGRKNKRRQHAFDVDCLKESLLKDGLEPLDIEVVPDAPATEPQIQLMIDRGIPIPPGLTKGDASSLISNYFERRDIAEIKDFDLARRLRIEVGQYDSKSAIYRTIFFEMTGRRSLQDLAAWYAFRVYRSAHNRAKPGGIGDPCDERFRDIGARIVADERLQKSLRRAAANSFVQFRWFGIYRAPDGREHQGDGNKSEVYRFVILALLDMGLLDERDVAGARSSTGKASKSLTPRSARRSMDTWGNGEAASQELGSAQAGCAARLANFAVGLAVIYILWHWLMR